MPNLKTYRQKRDPDKTPEPFGEDRRASALPAGAPRAFVVQQHDARRMHWDLRLEIEGVLVSWAVPKGPSLDPAEKRFAARTEDHPLEYGEFEGIIPAGNYGAGAMIVWDRGGYQIVDGMTPAEGLATGKLDLLMHGHKLRGRFALVRMKDEDGKSWLLIHKGQPPSGDVQLVDAQPESVLSGLTVAQLGDGISADAEIAEALAESGSRKRPFDFAATRPMLATAGDGPFSRAGWLFELKYDGMRVLAQRNADGQLQLRSRTGRDATATYPEIALAMQKLPLSEFVLDGEVVVLDEQGRSSFARLQPRFGLSDRGQIERAMVEAPVVLFAFDLLSAHGHDLRTLPLTTRKELLARFVPASGHVRFSDHVEREGEALFEVARQAGAEGVVAKRADSKYEAGRRSRTWLKVQVPRSANFTIVGKLAGKGSRKKLGSVMLAWLRDGTLTYAGNAGSGLDDATLDRLMADLSPVDAPPFEGGPERPAAGTEYARPELVCEVSYTEVTNAGMLRHPVFVRLRDDVSPQECVAADDSIEIAEPVVVGPPAPKATDLRLSNLDKVFWPDEGYTKRDLLDYYEAIWPWLEPYLKDRPVVLTRYPDGIDGKFFYQKNAPDFTPEWARREKLDGTDYFVCDELRTLLYVINSGAIPLHVWSARVSDIEKPDWLILDLDPKDAPFSDVIAVAKHIHKLLDELETAHFLKTSGQAGLHILLPLAGQLAHREAVSLAEVLARTVCAELPDISTIARPIAARASRVYVDYLQNGRGKLIAAPFSVRPRPHAPASAPLRWSQLTARLDPTRFTIKTLPKMMEKSGDPGSPLLGEGIDVPGLLAALGERLARTTG